MMRCQHNAWIHLVATAMMIAAGFFFHLSRPEWFWTAEALNTAFEFLADAASPNFILWCATPRM